MMSVLLTEAAAGGAVVLWCNGVFGKVRRGFFLLLGVTVALFAWGGWATARAGVQSAVDGSNGGSDALTVAVTGAPGSRLVSGLFWFAVLATVWQVVLLVKQSRASQVLGLATAVAGVISLILFALARGERVGLALAEVILGALFLGSTLYGLLLGHWYLVERRLSNVYMVRSSWWYIAGVVGAAGTAALSAVNPAPNIGGFSPFLAVPGFTLYLAAGLVAVCALIAGFVWKLAHEGGRSIQAATGMFYLAVIMAFSAELSAKFRFF